MQKYFDFNHNFNEALSTNKEKHANSSQEFSYAWNHQVNINNDHSVLSSDYKGMDRIASLMTEFKDALQAKWGHAEGMNKYNEIFLENGGIQQKDAVKNLYNSLNYTVAFGAAGKDIRQSFLNGDINAIDQVKSSLHTINPHMPSDFINEMVKEYKTEQSTRLQVQAEADNIRTTVGREAQIKFVKENIDSMHTNTQRFKEVWSDIKRYYSRDIDPITAIVTAPLALPVMAIGAAIKVFGGEAGEMKMHDVIEGIGKNLDNIKNNVKSFFTLSVTEKMHAIRKTAIGNDANSDNRFKM